MKKNVCITESLCLLSHQSTILQLKKKDQKKMT